MAGVFMQDITISVAPATVLSEAKGPLAVKYFETELKWKITQSATGGNTNKLSVAGRNSEVGSFRKGREGLQTWGKTRPELLFRNLPTSVSLPLEWGSSQEPKEAAPKTYFRNCSFPSQAPRDGAFWRPRFPVTQK